MQKTYEPGLEVPRCQNLNMGRSLSGSQQSLVSSLSFSSHITSPHLSTISDLYIPPESIRFRLVGYLSQHAIFSRTHALPEVWHYPASEDYPDHWFTLLHGSGNHSGLYAIKSQNTGKVLFSRNPGPTVGHIEGDGRYEDNWFRIEPGPGQYSSYFRLITPSQGKALVSRLSPDPTFSNSSSNEFHTGQLFSFFWEEMNINRVDFKLDAGSILTSTPITLGEQVLTNNSDTEREMSFSVEKSVSNSSTFQYNTGFRPTIGTEFSVGIPVITEGRFTVEASSANTWTWGKMSSYTIQYTATPIIKVDSRKTVRVASVVNQGTIEVPYNMYLSSKRTGVKVEMSGTWRGVSSWDLRHSITPLPSLR